MVTRGAARTRGGATPDLAVPAAAGIPGHTASSEDAGGLGPSAVGARDRDPGEIAPAALGNAVGSGIVARLGWRNNVGYRGAAAGDPEVDGVLRGHLRDAKDALRLAVIELDGGGARDGTSQAARRASAVRDLLREAVVSLSRARLYRREIFSFDVAVVYAEEASLAGEMRRLRGLLTSLYWRNLRYLQFDDASDSRRSALAVGGALQDGRRLRRESVRARGRGRNRRHRGDEDGRFETSVASGLRAQLDEEDRGAEASGSDRGPLSTAGWTPVPTEHDDVAVARFLEQIKAGRRRRIARWSTLATLAVVATAVAPAAITAWVLPVAAAAACVLHLWPRHGRREQEQAVLGLNAASPATGPSLR